MADFAESFIQGHQAGQQRQRQEQDFANAQEDRGIRKMLLDLELRKVKIEEAQHARELAKGNFDILNGQPNADLAQPIREGQTGVPFLPQMPGGPSMAMSEAAPAGSGAAPVSMQAPTTAPMQGSIQPVSIPGVPELGVGGVSVRPRSMEELFAAATSAKYRDLMMTPQKTGPGETVTLPGTGQVIASGGEKPKNEWETFQDAYPKTLGRASWAELTPQQQLRGFSAFSQSKTSPDAQEMAKLRATMLQIQMGQQPSAEDAKLFAKQMRLHKISPSQVQGMGGMGQAGAAFRRMVNTEALKEDPTFDWEQAESEYQLVKSPAFQNTTRYMQSAQESLPQLQRSAAALNNGRFKLGNTVENLAKTQINDPKIKAFVTDSLLVSDEVAKILSGGGTGSSTSDAKLSQAQTIFNTSDDVGAIAAAAKEVQTLIGYRWKALTKGTYLESQGYKAPAETDAGWTDLGGGIRIRPKTN